MKRIKLTPKKLSSKHIKHLLESDEVSKEDKEKYYKEQDRRNKVFLKKFLGKR